MNTDESTKPEEDEELGIQIGVENGNVVVIFSQQISVLGLPPAAARKMAKALKKHAVSAENLTREESKIIA